VINNKNNPVAWPLLLSELDEARDHLESLVKELVDSTEIEESDFAVHLGHVYAHLNRAWNSRNLDTEIPEEEWEEYSRFPDDLGPVG
jgi:hypothetical protein